MIRVRPSTVSNWKTRFTDFPKPVEKGQYVTDEVGRWLARRPVPRDALLPGEPIGSTYGDRFRKAIGGSPAEDARDHSFPGTVSRSVAGSAPTPEPDLWNQIDRRRGVADLDVYEELLLSLLHLLRYGEAHWAALVRAAGAPSPGRIGQLLMHSLAQHRAEHRHVTAALGRVRPVLWSDWQLAEIIKILDRACSDGPRHAPPTATRPAAVCRFLLDRFATADRARDGEFYTPQNLVALMVRLLAPEPDDRVYDPCCGNGSLLVAAAAYVEEHSGTSQRLTINGQALGERSLVCAKLNLGINGIAPGRELRRADPLRNDLYPDRQFDVIFANPPYNTPHWSEGDPADDPRWRYGTPPRHNANFAWLQHIAGKLSPRGRAAVLLPNVAAVSANDQEAAIRESMVDESLVEAVVMLPEQLFRATPVPVTLWLLRRRPPEKGDRVLFIDARSMGVKAERAHRVLTDDDIGRIVDAYTGWRRLGATYADVPGFSASATKDLIKREQNALAPNRYVKAKSRTDGRAERRIRELCAALAGLHEEAVGVDTDVDRELRRILG
jgi:type I restriction enzyme M protein